MTEDQDILDDKPGGIQVEVIPEPDEDKPRMKTGDTRSLDVRDEEIGKYGKEVQDRIKKLRFAFHEERRVREQKERDFTTASDAASRLYRENQELKRSVARTEQAVVHQAISRVDAEISQARQANRDALNAGNADQIVDAGEKLARAVAEKERLSLLQSTGDDRDDPPPPPQQQQQQPQQDERTRQWFSKNSWWGKPGQEERTALAMGVHQSLTNRGVTATSNPDLYWKTIDERLARHFPASGGESSQEEREDAQDRDTGSRPLAVAGGTRSNTGAANNAGRTRVIRLSESQVRLARKLGLTPEQYAHQLALEQGVA